jgi:hypothetical protein
MAFCVIYVFRCGLHDITDSDWPCRGLKLKKRLIGWLAGLGFGWLVGSRFARLAGCLVVIRWFVPQDWLVHVCLVFGWLGHVLARLTGCLVVGCDWLVQ